MALSKIPLPCHHCPQEANHILRVSPPRTDKDYRSGAGTIELCSSCYVRAREQRRRLV